MILMKDLECIRKKFREILNYLKFMLFFPLILFFSLLYAEEHNDLAFTENDINTSIYTWNALGIGEAYPAFVSANMDPSGYDWNALHSRWVNTRAAMAGVLDLSHFYQDDRNVAQVGDLSHYDRVDVRALRFGVLGTINFDKPWTYIGQVTVNSLTKDFDSAITDKYTLYDAALGIPLWGDYGRVQIGKMKAPISMERIMSLIFTQTMERPTHLDALLDARNIGISFSDMIFDERFTWRVGAFNDWLEEDHLSFSEANQEAVGRITAVVYEDEGKERLLHLGAGYRYLDIREGSIRYEEGPEQWFVGPWVDTGNFAADASRTANLEMSYLEGPLWISSEYTVTSVDSPQFGNPTFRGYHVAVNYFITGEHRGYNNRLGIVRRILPILDFTNGGWGAVEVSGRYSSLDLTDGAINGGTIEIGSLGLIWHPRRDMQFHIQWSRAHLNRINEEIDSMPAESVSDILQFRLVVMVD